MAGAIAGLGKGLYRCVGFKVQGLGVGFTPTLNPKPLNPKPIILEVVTHGFSIQ